ncbi:MAG: serine/threonine protein kinase [Candidatus Obscuribacterales bacterium]|jgi:serine/threonine protein kinase|nr:serine/threonine protein kinase [Candidatus Obscuribacterales bacterium]
MESRIASGTLIDGIFEVTELLGTGAMASVFLAKHLTMHRMVAVKVLNELKAADADAVKRFQDEAVAIAKLDNEHIVKVLTTGTWNERPYISMEYLDGETLEQCNREKSLEATEIRRIGAEICDALSHAHAAGVIHRDIKPSNILLVGNNKASKLTDFGIAKLINKGDQGLTATGEILGTPAYMSPEQLLNKAVDHRADIYSLACVLYEALSGSPPFVKDTPYQVAQAHLSEEAKPLPRFAGLNRVLLKALSKSPSDRYQSCLEFKNALNGASIQQHNEATGNQNKRINSLSAALSILVIAIALVWLFVSKMQTTSPLDRSESPLTKSVAPSRKIEDILAELKSASDDVERTKLLKEAYASVESADPKSIARSAKLNLWHDYAAILADQRLYSLALPILEKILTNVEKHGLPSKLGQKDERFGPINHFNCQAKAIEILADKGELSKAKTLYERLQKDAGKDSSGLLRAAIIMEDENTIKRVAAYISKSNSAAVKIARILLEHDYLNELGLALNQSFSPSLSPDEYTEYQADLMIVQAKYFLLRNEPEKAVRLVRNFSSTSSPKIKAPERNALLNECVEILCVAGRLEEARKLLIHMKVEDAPPESLKLNEGDKEELAVSDKDELKHQLRSLGTEKDRKRVTRILDTILKFSTRPDSQKAMIAIERASNSASPGVSAYYIALANGLVKNVSDTSQNVGFKIVARSTYAEFLRHTDLLDMAETIVRDLVNKHDLSKADDYYVSHLQSSYAIKAEILQGKNKKQELKELLKSLPQPLNEAAELHSFVELFIETNNERRAKELISDCKSYYELIWTTQTCLKRDQMELAQLCLDRAQDLLAKEPPNSREQKLGRCGVTIIGSLNDLSQGNMSGARKWFNDSKLGEDDLPRDFAKTYLILKALSS